MGIIKGFTFDGEKSLDYDIGITGSAVYNAPTKDVDMVKIPGRNGELALDHGRFNNIEVTYPAGFGDTNQPDFAERISDLRNALASRVGYKRLEDEYNPDEYRMAVYKSGLEVNPVQYGRAGEFDIVFDCKPQRYLKSGEVAYDLSAWNNLRTTSGEAVMIKDGDEQSIKSLLVDINPVISGYGTPSPTNPRTINPTDGSYLVKARKNLLEPRRESGYVYENNGVTFTYEGAKIRAQGTATANASIRVTTDYFRACEGTILSGCPQGGSPSTYEMQMEVNGSVYRDYGNGVTIPRSGRGYGYVLIRPGQTVDLLFEPMVRMAGTSSVYEKYNGLRYYKALNENVYKGTLNIITGELTITHKGIDISLSGATGTSRGGASSNYKGFYTPLINDIKNIPFEETPTDLLCNRAVGTSRQANYNCTPGVAIHQSEKRIYIYLNELANKTLAEAQAWLVDNPMTVMYPLATPITTTVNTANLRLYNGLTNIYSSRGEVLSLEYGDKPGDISNPTLFPSRPLLAVKGYGGINMNGYEMNIENAMLGNVVLIQPFGGSPSKSGFFPAGLLNNGDTITVARGSKIYVNLKAQSNVELIGVLVNSLTSHFSVSSSMTDTNIALEVTFNEAHFTAGTNDSVSANFTVNVQYRVGGGLEDFVNITLAPSIDYTASNRRIYISCGQDTIPTPPIASITKECRCQQVTGDSTISALGDPTYIDCEIGEAYKIVNGNPVSLNNVVTIGGKLPELSPGNNSVTYDGTITELKTTPRWWKI